MWLEEWRKVGTYVSGRVEGDVVEAEGVGVLRGRDDTEPLAHQVLLQTGLTVSVLVSRPWRERPRTLRNFLVRYLR